jgi:hypothetical protein
MAMTAGLALVAMAVLAGFGYLGVVDALVTPGDASRTITELRASRELFTAAVIALWVVVALDVVVAWALYRVFRPVNRRVSRIAAWMRVVYAGAFAVAIGQLTAVLGMLDPAIAEAEPSVEALTAIETFHSIWDAGLAVFGLHLVLVGYLAFRSGFVPRWLAVLVGIAGIGYAFDSLTGAFAAAGSIPDVSPFTFLGELLIAFWLVILARRLR